VNEAPFPRPALFTETDPPMDRTIFWQIARPSPVPSFCFCVWGVEFRTPIRQQPRFDAAEEDREKAINAPKVAFRYGPYVS